MQQRMKQRLVGAVVLVALAVIFVPMLLDGPNPRDPADIPIQIPPKPEVAEPAAPQTAPVDNSAVMSDATPVVSAPAADPAPAAPEAAPTPTPPAQAPAQTPAQPATQAPVAQPTPPPVAPDEPAPKPNKLPQELASWAVQVGSFGDQSHAVALRDRLRKKGYQTYTDKVSANGKTFYRVRVGPMAKRADAEAMLAKLAKQEQLQGQVRPHP